MDCINYLQALFGNFFEENRGFIEVRAIIPKYSPLFQQYEGEKNPNIKRFFYPSIDDLLKDFPTLQKLNHDGFNIYSGMNPRAEKWKGEANDIKHMVCLWCDVDYGTDKKRHKKAPIHKTREDALAAIEKLPLKPSIIVSSGSGFYCIWLLKELEEINPETRALAEGTMRGLASLCGGDSTHDISRILKLPGTVCMKIPETPLSCEVIASNE